MSSMSQKMFELIGEPREAAEKDARTVMDIETALAKASLTRVDKRDPYKLFHKMTPRAVRSADSRVCLAALLSCTESSRHVGD